MKLFNVIFQQLVFWIIFIPLFYFIIKKFSPSRMLSEKSQAPESESPAISDPHWSFIAMQYYALILNRTYKVWVTEKYICAGRVEHAIASPPSYLSVGPQWQNAQNYSEPEFEKKYSNIDITSDAFLKVDKANFRILREDITGITYFPKKWGMGRVPYSGRLVLKTRNGNVYEFILLGKQNAEEIRQRLLKT